MMKNSKTKKDIIIDKVNTQKKDFNYKSGEIKLVSDDTEFINSRVLSINEFSKVEFIKDKGPTMKIEDWNNLKETEIIDEGQFEYDWWENDVYHNDLSRAGKSKNIRIAIEYKDFLDDAFLVLKGDKISPDKIKITLKKAVDLDFDIDYIIMRLFGLKNKK